ncbi:AsmA-like C-terminal region-containing protein [Roseovarius salinarum]|uniref:AsmA-like C-terminal region-containing protein n=1 Tax=Roseovarius salinarum TaxID=1981892 RepID=UPI000C334CA6|nr:AsmA-like C-terminal region-containing protein [Roseovarius salinarum]
MTQPRGPAPRRWRRGGLFVLLGGAGIALAAAVALVATLGRPMTAPDWVRDHLRGRLQSVLPGLSVEVGEVAVVIEEGWQPRLLARDVALREADGGRRLLRLSQVEGAVAAWPLLQGRLQPGEIRLSGAHLRLQRAKDGQVDVAPGGAVAQGLAEDAAGADLGALIARVERVLQQPHFAALDLVEARNLTLRYEDRRAGRAWTVDGGRMELTRDGARVRLHGDFALLGARGYATTLQMDYESRLGERAARFGFSFEDMPAGDIAGQSPALAWLGALQAPISGGLRASVDESGALGPLEATLRIGAGVLRPTPATKPVAFDSAESRFTYDPQTQSMHFEEVALESPWVRARAEGRAVLRGMEGGWPDELLAQMKVSRIRANPDDLYPAPVAIEGASMDMRLQLDPFVLTLGEMSISDQGERLVLDGRVEAREQGWNLALDGRMGGLDPDRLLDLWPQRLKTKTRSWIAENVREGRLENIELAVRSQPKSRPDLFLTFDYADLTTRFMKKMPPITGGAGHAALINGRFVITAREGAVTAPQGGRVDITGTSFIVPDVRIKKGPAKVMLNTRSTITATLSLLDHDPFNFLTKAGRPVTLADGRAALTGRLDFILKRKIQPREVAFDIAGTLSDVRSDKLVDGRTVAAPEIAVQAVTDELRLSGRGRVGAVPVQAEWSAPLRQEGERRSTLEGWIELSDRFVEEFRIGLPPGSMKGAGRGDIRLDMARGAPPEFTLRSDLSGLELELEPLGWRKAAGRTGTLEVAGQLGDAPRIDRLRLEAPGLEATGGRVTLTQEGQLERASFERVQAGRWLDAPVQLVGRGAGAPPQVVLDGGTADLRYHTLNAAGGESGTSPEGSGSPVTLALDRLQISESIALTDMRAELETGGGLDGTFSGRVNGGARVAGRVVPRTGRNAFRIRSQDAGGVFAASGLLQSAEGGSMELVLVPAGAPGSYNGQLEAEDVRLRDAPALAALLNALSIVGLLEQMVSGEGILLGQVMARFELTPDQLRLLSSSATGPSLGISMDGYYDMGTGMMNMQGVFSPLYFVNAIGSIFTRRGEGLVGFNYNLTGPAESPRVEVNPLSLFTPGMFREMFRRSPPQPTQ